MDSSTLIAILTSLLSGLIGAILVFALITWKEHQKQIRKRKNIAIAFLMEINKYQSFFQTILATYQNLSELGYPYTGTFDTTSYQITLFNAIVNYPAIASTGNNSGILKNNSPFIEFHKEIFEFDNEDVVAELDRYCDHIFLANKFFKNYCDINTRIENDILHFIENIQRANDLMRGGKTIAYLQGLTSPGDNYMKDLKWDWTIRLGVVIGLTGLYFPISFGFVSDFKNYPEYFWALFMSLIAGIFITILLEKSPWIFRKMHLKND